MDPDARKARWAVSIVSHGHGRTVLGIIQDVHAQLKGQPHRIILTQNIPEPESILYALPAGLREHLSVRCNTRPAGFGANHNAALLGVDAEFVLMADPELRLDQAIFAPLETHLRQTGSGIVSPRAKTPQGRLEDNGRPLFTPGRLLKRYMLGRRFDSRRMIRRYTDRVDWLAGLFLAMRQPVFEQLNGFDPGYFMYCEDIDICLRAQQLGLSCELLNDLEIIHPPRRGTFRSLRHLTWHLRSLLRLWRSQAYRDFRQQAAKEPE